MWASGGEASASPWLVHTLRRTALGPKDASTPSALGVAADALVVSGSDWHREELARTGRPPPGHGRCSFDTHRGTPASHTLEPGRGAMQVFRAVRTTRTGAVRSHATAPTRARPRAGRASLAGTVPRATPRSACCRTFCRPGCRARSTSSKRWWRTRSGPRAFSRRRTRFAPIRSHFRARCAGCGAGCAESITSW